MCTIRIHLTRESLALIREIIEAELKELEANGDCEKHLVHCVALMDLLEELPKIQ